MCAEVRGRNVYFILFNYFLLTYRQLIITDVCKIPAASATETSSINNVSVAAAADKNSKSGDLYIYMKPTIEFGVGVRLYI